MSVVTVGSTGDTGRGNWRRMGQTLLLDIRPGAAAAAAIVKPEGGTAAVVYSVRMEPRELGTLCRSALTPVGVGRVQGFFSQVLVRFAIASWPSAMELQAHC